MDERTEKFLIIAMQCAIAFVIACATYYFLAHLVSYEPFGHDDAVYLTKARAWLLGTPADQWGIYRPVGMSIVAWVLLHFDSSEHFLRMFGVFSGALTSAFIYLFFRSVTNLWTSITITVMSITSYVFLLQAPGFLNDVASTGFLFGVMWAVYVYYKSNGASNVIFLAAVFAAIAFYLRYGVVEALAVIGAFSLILLLPRFLYESSADFRKLGLTVVLAGLLFAPHFIYSLNVTKQLFGVLLDAGDAAHRAYIGEGLVQYFKWLPDQLGGWPIGIAAIVGACLTVPLLVMKQFRQKYPVLVWIGGTGLVTFIITGLLVHAEPRYVLFPMILLSGLAIMVVHSFAERVSTLLASGILLVITIVCIGFGLSYFDDLQNYFKTRQESALSIAYSEAHEAVRSDSAQAAGCSLWIVRFQPRASWYTGCRIFDLNNVDQFKKQFHEHADEPAYSIDVTNLKNTQLDAKTAERYGVLLNEIHRTHVNNYDVIVYRIIDFPNQHVIFKNSITSS